MATRPKLTNTMNKYVILHIREGEIQNKGAVKKLFDELKSKDGTVKLSWEDAKKRTLPQNAWLHAVLPSILKGLRDRGYNEVRNEDDAKDIIKALFFKKKVTNGIEEIEVIEGTSETSKVNFAEKADQIITWGRDYLGIDIAPPAKQFEMYDDIIRIDRGADANRHAERESLTRKFHNK